MSSVSEDTIKKIDFSKLHIDPFLDPSNNVSTHGLRYFFQILISCWPMWPLPPSGDRWWRFPDDQPQIPRFVEGYTTALEITDAGKAALSSIGKVEMYLQLKAFADINGLKLYHEVDYDDDNSLKVFVRNVRGIQPGEWKRGRCEVVTSINVDPD